MNILCYGNSATRQKGRCEFFIGAGCDANWATDVQNALSLLARKHFDVVVFARSASDPECVEVSGTMLSLCPKLKFFYINALEIMNGQHGGGDLDSFGELAGVFTSTIDVRRSA